MRSFLCYNSNSLRKVVFFMKKVITISRECGSGGHTIGEKIAKDLGIPIYDREIIEMTAKESGLTTEFVKESNERITNSILFNIANSMTYANHVFSSGTVSMVDKVFFIQCDIIKKLAADGPCVIVGRCADYILEEEENVMKFYIWASIENRIRRAKEVYGDSHTKAGENILKIDKKRSSYYKYHSGKKWGHYINYDGILRSDLFGIEGTVNILEQMIMANEKELIGEDSYV